MEVSVYLALPSSPSNLTSGLDRARKFQSDSFNGCLTESRDPSDDDDDPTDAMSSSGCPSGAR